MLRRRGILGIRGFRGQTNNTYQYVYEIYYRDGKLGIGQGNKYLEFTVNNIYALTALNVGDFDANTSGWTMKFEKPVTVEIHGSNATISQE